MKGNAEDEDENGALEINFVKCKK